VDFVNLSMQCSKQNLTTMGLLHEAHVENFGHPVPTPVKTGTKAGKEILIGFGHNAVLGVAGKIIKAERWTPSSISSLSAAVTTPNPATYYIEFAEKVLQDSVTPTLAYGLNIVPITTAEEELKALLG